MENEKVCCAEIREKTVNNYMKENDELIFKIRYIAKKIENEIFCSNENECDNPSPSCLMHALEIQNYNLRETIDILEKIENTITAN